MDTVYRDLTGRNEVLFIYTQRWVPGRAFEAIGSLGGLTLATVVTKAGYQGYSFAGITPRVVRLIEEHEDRLYAVCFYCDFDNQTAVSAILAGLQEAPFYKLVGGPQTMHIRPEEAAGFHADAILCGDGEESVLAWLDSHRVPKPDHEHLLQETTAEKKGTYTLLSSFSPYPVPDDSRDLGFRTGLFSVISARGCPHRCAFCFEGGNSKKLRPRPVEEVLGEIRTRLAQVPRLNYLFFADDTFTYDIRRLQAFCDGLKELRRERDFVWFCEGHASFFRRYPWALSMMVDAGMVRMQIGMESGCDEVLAAYGKQIVAEDIRYTARLAEEAGLPQLVGNYIIGGAWETMETALRTRSFVLSLLEEFPGLLDISTTFPIPLSGTKLTEDPESFGIIWQDREFVTSLEDVPVNRTSAMSADQICRARARLLHEALEKMKSLAAQGKVPAKRIMRSMELYFRYGITDNWGSYIFRKDPWLRGYARACLEKGFLPWDEAKGHPYSHLVPVRTVPVRQLGDRSVPDDVLSFILSADGRCLDEIRTALGLSRGDLERAAREADRLWAVVYAAYPALPVRFLM